MNFIITFYYYKGKFMGLTPEQQKNLQEILQNGEQKETLQALLSQSSATPIQKSMVIASAPFDIKKNNLLGDLLGMSIDDRNAEIRNAEIRNAGRVVGVNVDCIGVQSDLNLRQKFAPRATKPHGSVAGANVQQGTGINKENENLIAILGAARDLSDNSHGMQNLKIICAKYSDQQDVIQEILNEELLDTKKTLFEISEKIDNQCGQNQGKHY